jgi:hypothetical protein
MGARRGGSADLVAVALPQLKWTAIEKQAFPRDFAYTTLIFWD